MTLFTINKETCNQDGICAAVCPFGLIEFEKGSYPAPIDGAERLCIDCGHCVACCPTGSLSHEKMTPEQCPSVKKEWILTEDQCEHFLRYRRSIRSYKDKPVPKESLQRLIEVARYAPSGYNSQCVEWLVLSNREELRKLAGIVVDWKRWMIQEMPDVAARFNFVRNVKQYEQGVDIILRDAPALIVAHANKENLMAPPACIIALTYLELAATSLGLGGCWAGYFNRAANTFPPMMDALALPEGHQSFGAMMIGYPKFYYHRLPERKIPTIAWRS